MKITAKQIKQEILDMVNEGIFDSREPYIFEDLPFGEGADVKAILEKYEWKSFLFVNSSGQHNNVIIAKSDSIFGKMYPYFIMKGWENLSVFSR